MWLPSERGMTVFLGLSSLGPQEQVLEEVNRRRSGYLHTKPGMSAPPSPLRVNRIASSEEPLMLQREPASASSTISDLQNYRHVSATSLQQGAQATI
jgi:hypothetical protein